VTGRDGEAVIPRRMRRGLRGLKVILNLNLNPGYFVTYLRERRVADMYLGNRMVATLGR
jgi:hypothetical protein